MRSVVDTNIFVRAIIRPQGTVGPVLQQLRDGAYRLIYSDPLLDELVDVLTRPRITRKYGISAADLAIILRLIALRGEKVFPTRRIAVCRDSKDDKFLEAASAGGADYIVSGDEDLLVLNPFEGIAIISPADFLVRLNEQSHKI